MPAIWSFLEVSDRPYGPWHSAYRHPWTHIPPMSWLLCRPLLPQLNLSALVPHFRVRPLFQVRLLPPGSARSFRSAYVPDKSACSGPPTPHWSVRVCAVESTYNLRRHFCPAGNVRVSPPPVYLFSGIRARKRPTDMELSDCFRVGN